MFFLFLLSLFAAAFFGMRWFMEHSFDYYNGVKLSEQIDTNFWIFMSTSVLTILFCIAVFL